MQYNNFNNVPCYISDIEKLVSLWEKESPRRVSLKTLRDFYQYIKKLLFGNESNFFSRFLAIALISSTIFLFGIVGVPVVYVANFLFFKNVELIKPSQLIFLKICILLFADCVIIRALNTLSDNGIISIPRSNETDTSKYITFDILTKNTKINFIELKNFCQIKLDEINARIDRVSKIISTIVIGIIITCFNSMTALLITVVFNYFQNSIDESTLIDALINVIRILAVGIILLILLYVSIVYITKKILELMYKSDAYVSLRDIAASKLVFSS